MFLRHGDKLADSRALVRDRGSQFIDTFDEIFATEGMKILKTPVRTPVANSFAERWIGHRSRTVSPNAGPERCAASFWTGPSSGTANNLSASLSTTSIITTCIGPIDLWINIHTKPSLSRDQLRGQTCSSSHQAAATD